MTPKSIYSTPAISDEEMAKRTEFTASRRLPDGSVIAAGPMMHGNGRLFMDVNRVGYESCYCYDTLEGATEAMYRYNPETDDEPDGWKRDPYTGRRRPNGDKSKQTINP
jgi:hypothetical protein